ncbi:MAG TPA: glucose-1-phosphate cytidylyltransferase, partial [Gaiella sp.]
PVKVAILAGGLGSRISEETEVKPKPMVEIGGRPILWHIMKIYAHHDLTDFVIALGYKGDYIKRWMIDYCSLASDLTVSLKHGVVKPHANGNGNGGGEDWTIDLVDTGHDTATGGRIKRLAPYLGDETFMLTWGDGVADIDLNDLYAFHRAHGRLATMTTVRPPARFGHLTIDGDRVTEFSEKPQLGEGWINGAFFVLEPEVFDYVDGDDTQWEREPLERLAQEGQLMAYRHTSFWQCMDTLRDKKLLEELWQNGAPWRVWSS